MAGRLKYCKQICTTAATVTLRSWQRWLGRRPHFPFGGLQPTDSRWKRNMVSLVSSVTELMRLPISETRSTAILLLLLLLFKSYMKYMIDRKDSEITPRACHSCDTVTRVITYFARSRSCCALAPNYVHNCSICVFRGTFRHTLKSTEGTHIPWTLMTQTIMSF